MNISSQQIADDLILLLYRTKSHIHTCAEERSLTSVQLFVLYSIQQKQEATMGQIAAILRCDASNVTGIIERLVSQQLVSRQEDTHDRRVKTLRLTSKGASIVTEIRQQLPDLLGCDQLTTDERETFHSIIAKIAT